MELSVNSHMAAIDLGTTNSLIARIDLNTGKPYCIPINDNETILPSAVSFDNDRIFFTGREAINKIMTDMHMNGHVEFKRKMGQGEVYPVANLGRNLLPEELSGCILRKLKDVYSNHMHEELRTVVVTIPMRFLENAAKATRFAACGSNKFLLDPRGYVRQLCDKELNPAVTPKVNPVKPSEFYCDFLNVELLMEPIAAATAYGMSGNFSENSIWLVYDLGGGTFDVALVNNYGNTPHVIGSSGNEHLGGKDMDDLLLIYVLTEIIKDKNKYQIDIQKFMNNPDNRLALTLLKLMVEQKKIELSEKVNSVIKKMRPDISEEDFRKTVKKVSVDIDIPEPVIRDDTGKEVNIKITLTAGRYNSIISGILLQTVENCIKLLADKKLSPGDIDRIILVGGPTRYYYASEFLKQKLGIRIDQSIDPMLAVAQGAAIFANSKKVEDTDVRDVIECIKAKGGGKIKVKLNYPSEGSNANTEFITGEISDDKKYDHIRIFRSDGGWDSKPVVIEPDQTFILEVPIVKQNLNIFNIELTNSGHSIVATDPDYFSIPNPPRTRDVAPHNLNVTLFDGTCYCMIKKDTPLPAEGSHDFLTTAQILKKGESKPVLEIEITEGESMYSDRNTIVEKLVFTNEHIETDLPAGANVPVTIEQMGNRQIHARAKLGNKEIEGTLSSTKTDYSINHIQSFYNKLISEDEKFTDGLERWGTDEMKEKYQKLDVPTVKKKVDDLTDKYNETRETDHLTNARKTIADVLIEMETFEFDFILVRIEKRLAEMDSIKKSGGNIEEVLPGFMLTFKTLQTEGTRLMDNNDIITHYKEAQVLEEQLLEYDREILFIRLVYLLFLYTNTREKSFMGFFVELINFAKKTFSDNYLFSLQIQVQNVIDIWNIDVNDLSHFIIYSKYLSKLRGFLEYNMYKIFEKMDQNDDGTYQNFTLKDYETIARHFNKLYDAGKSRYDFDNCKVMAAFKPDENGIVLKNFVKCAKLLNENRIDEFFAAKSAFIDSYYYDSDIAPKGGDEPGGLTQIKAL
jgi:molecular chaperone DnaK